MKQTYFYFLVAFVSFQSLSAQVLDATISVNGGNQLVITINSDASFQFSQAHAGAPSLVIQDVYSVDITPPGLTTSVSGGSGISFTGSNGNMGTAIQMGPFGLEFGVFTFRDDEITFTEPAQDFAPGDIITIEAGTIISLSTFDTPPPINPGPFNAFIASDDYLSIAATQVVLPVEFTEFSGRKTADDVYLNWQTASETNNKGFQVEHATDVMPWTTIGFIEGEGTISAHSNYEFIHKRPNTGANYYRLKQIDFDGSYAYSKVITLDFTAPGEFTVSPNPTSGIINLEGVQEGFITILDASGRVLKNQALSGSEIDVSELPAGLLFLLLSSDDKSITRRIIKL